MATKELQQPTAGAGPPAANRKETDLAALRALGFGNLTDAGAVWVEALGLLGSEMVSFVAERIKEDIRTQHDILHCTDPAELNEIHARFLKTAMDQYTAESRKLAEMCQEMVRRQLERAH